MIFVHKPLLHEVIECARICHEVNRAYCWSVGDSSHPRWENASTPHKDGVIADINTHVASGLTLKPEEEHANWLAQMKVDGWKYGPEKDADKKRHPCLVPYKDLTPERKTHYHLFRTVVHAFFARHVTPYAG